MIKVTKPRRVRVSVTPGHVLVLGVILSQAYRGSITSPFTWLSLYLLVLHYCYIKRVPLQCGCLSCEAWKNLPSYKWGSYLS